MADLPGHVVPAPVDLVVEDDRRAHAVANIQHHDVPEALGRAELVLRHGHRLHVVFQNERPIRQAAPQMLQQGHALPLVVGGEDHLAPAHVQNAGHHHAHGAAEVLPPLLPQELL